MRKGTWVKVIKKHPNCDGGNFGCCADRFIGKGIFRIQSSKEYEEEIERYGTNMLMSNKTNPCLFPDSCLRKATKEEIREHIAQLVQEKL